MSKMWIQGNNELNGEIKVSGAKNSTVALIPAAIMTDDEVTIENVPDITDIGFLKEILDFLEVESKRKESTFITNPKNMKNKEIPGSISKKLRASYYFMGALLGKYNEVVIALPGGCNIGKRPIDLHLKAFEKMGTTIKLENDKYFLKAKKLKGTDIYLDFPSVGATINIMLAATLAEGTTIIENAAKEPEIVNIATFLNEMGAKIYGAGTGIIKIKGVKKLNGCKKEVIPDRIEAGTYAIIATLMGKEVKITNIIPDHIIAVITKLVEVGASIKIGKNYIIVKKAKKLKPVNIKTQVYPGFPTDLQQPMTALLTQCIGESIVEETIYENRFQNVQYLNKLGADITIEGKKIRIKGPKKLESETIVSTDLRGGTSLVIAALMAKGVTIIKHTDHVLRGYEDIDDKLQKLGGKIIVEK